MQDDIRALCCSILSIVYKTRCTCCLAKAGFLLLCKLELSSQSDGLSSVRCGDLGSTGGWQTMEPSTMYKSRLAVGVCFSDDGKYVREECGSGSCAVICAEAEFGRRVNLAHRRTGLFLVGGGRGAKVKRILVLIIIEFGSPSIHPQSRFVCYIWSSKSDTSRSLWSHGAQRRRREIFQVLCSHQNSGNRLSSKWKLYYKSHSLYPYISSIHILGVDSPHIDKQWYTVYYLKQMSCKCHHVILLPSPTENIWWRHIEGDVVPRMETKCGQVKGRWIEWEMDVYIISSFTHLLYPCAVLRQNFFAILDNFKISECLK